MERRVVPNLQQHSGKGSIPGIRLVGRDIHEVNPLLVHRRRGQQPTDILAARVSFELLELSEASNVKALTNHAYGYRLRVGKGRVFFDFDGAVCIVNIEEVKKRNERTY